MKSLALLFVIPLAFGTAFPHAAHANTKDIEISANRKKLDASRSRDRSNVTVDENEIAYVVTLKSRSFQKLTDLTVKYNIFVGD